ncbi:histidine phosphatase family protein [Methylobacterium brachythecii]|uniref:Histidine phosphatase family protein n=1 Tax=Methylobacterium brachythecii TaxID=1176177 RepID=A0A7W6ALU9_9HYPH|nr:histidine phosphatase family protein [Methylobacterium brachythecii]MBB3904119.1 hypothetical protein [Methylobacterium brachythecii]GLS42861.1 hypothetical protein GCM10007884_08460 [Methylobacterium brachythecii]
MSALTIILARHAEKPQSGYPGPGTDVDGNDDDKSLVVRGWQRAGAWAALFGSGLGSEGYPRPGIVYAAKPEPIAKKAKFSHRPYETAIPTAQRLGLEPITKFGVGNEKDLVAEVLDLTGVVLIFWEHKAIAGSIMPLLCGSQKIPGVPKEWDGNRFDVAFRFDRALPSAPWSFRQLSPILLSGDSEAPFKERTE